MTICIATLLNVYNEAGVAVTKSAITASDRMITGCDGKIEYEPFQRKVGQLNKNTTVLIAGPFEIHSEAIRKTMGHLQANAESDTGVISEIYGSYIRDIRKRYAEQTFLSPWGLTTETFLAKTKELSADFVAGIINQLENYPVLPTEAIIVGHDGALAHLYHVDAIGRVTCHDDIGFIAIGSGADHALSRLMEIQYSHTWPYAASLLATYSAKKKAEIAPGVGQETDMMYIDQTGATHVVTEFTIQADILYKDYESKKKLLEKEALNSLIEYMKQHKIIQANLDAIKAENKTGDENKDEPQGSDKKEPTQEVHQGTPKPKG